MAKTDIKDVESKPKSGADLSDKKDDKVKTELSGKEAVIDKELLEVCSQKFVQFKNINIVLSSTCYQYFLYGTGFQVF